MIVEKHKICDYLLNKEKSRGKAYFFLKMGFESFRWEVLAESLKQQAQFGVISNVIESPFGTRYTIDGPLETPDGRSNLPKIRTVWVEEPHYQEWRLVTAYPL